MGSSRRQFLTSAGIVGAGIAGGGLLLPKRAFAAPSSYGPFTQYQFQILMATANESYIQAYIRDPSNPYFASSFPSLDGGDAGFTNALQIIDSAFSSAGLYNQNYDVSDIPAFGSTNPYWHTFIANSAQLGIKADFFTALANQGFASTVGIQGTTGYFYGSDMQAGIASMISTLQQYRTGNYSNLKKPGTQSRIVSAVYHPAQAYHLLKVDYNSTTAVIAAGSVALVGTGLKMIEMGGGLAALTAFFSGEAIAGGVAASVFLSGGTVLVVLGFAAAAYVAYRIVTQVQGESGPWTHPDIPDAQYLPRLQNKPSVFPPYMSQPTEVVTSTVTY